MDIGTFRGAAPISTVQNRYNLTDRRHEDVLEYCEAAGIAFLPWLPVANGAHAVAGGPLARVAEETGGTPVQVALAWLLARSPIILPIPGTSSAAHLEENMGAARIELTEDQFRRLDALGRPQSWSAARSR